MSQDQELLLETTTMEREENVGDQQVKQTGEQLRLGTNSDIAFAQDVLTFGMIYRQIDHQASVNRKSGPTAHMHLENNAKTLPDTYSIVTGTHCQQCVA